MNKWKNWKTLSIINKKKTTDFRCILTKNKVLEALKLYDFDKIIVMLYLNEKQREYLSSKKINFETEIKEYNENFTIAEIPEPLYQEVLNEIIIEDDEIFLFNVNKKYSWEKILFNNGYLTIFSTNYFIFSFCESTVTIGYSKNEKMTKNLKDKIKMIIK